MAASQIRIGIIGAGNNTRLRHIPGFRSLPGVEIVSVVNRTPESTARAAAEFGIPRTHRTWEELVEDPQIDAVLIGTWPNLHCAATCAALANGKHVLTEARMARNVAEAREMLAASERRPDLVAQIVPSPFGLFHDAYIRELLKDGFLGHLREVVVVGADDRSWDYSRPLHWREDAALSGYNTLTLGILHETLLRWVDQPARVFAQSHAFEPTRPDLTTGGDIPVTVPDSVQIVTQAASGMRGLYHLSGIALFGPGQQIHLYGSHGTLRISFGQTDHLYLGRSGDEGLREIEIPPEMAGGWRVEAEFISAIRGEEPVRYTDFPTGLKYMEFTEAVARSAAEGQTVNL